MIKRFALICAFMCLSVAQVDQQVRHLILNDANLIETSRGYAINAPSLLQNNWKSVSVNGDNIQMIASNCQQTLMTKQQFINSMGQQNLLESARQSLYSIENGNYQMGGQQQTIFRSGSARYSLNGNSISTSMTRNLGVSNFNSDGISVTKYDNQNMSISKRAGAMPGNINRVFISGDLVTFVYQDGRVQMKPSACLTVDEQQLVQQLKLETQEAKRKFDIRMQQFQQSMNNMQRNLQMNMNNMNQNMQMNMQNMQQNMDRMFQPNFPFNQQQQQQLSAPFASNQNSASFASNNGFGSGFSLQYPGSYSSSHSNGGAGAYSQAGGAQAIASGGGGGSSWPFGSNNNPFSSGFPFGRK